MMASAASRFAGFPDIATAPNQPSSCFTTPKRLFGKRGSLSGNSFTIMMRRQMIRFFLTIPLFLKQY